MSGSLFCVALPIGNSKDLSERAREILASVDIIACEDTRKLKSFLARAALDSPARFLAYHSHNESASSRGIIDLLQQGQSAALVTDAGTPLISDPGISLVAACRRQNIPVTPVPGASALTALLSVSPLPVSPFLFLGFISPKKGRQQTLLTQYQEFQGAVVFFESVHRIGKLLRQIHSCWGEREIFIARELTKQYEEFFWGNLTDAIAWAENKRGEFCFIVRKE